MSAARGISPEHLREIVSYDPETGRFVWRQRMGTRALAGAEAGCTLARGERKIKIYGQPYYGHILAWVYVYGEWPEMDIDHRDGDPGNNRIANLRLATSQQNNSNRRRAQRNSASGILGVDLSRSGWRAQIKVHGKKIGLGYFPTAELAQEAYLAAKAELHPFWAAA